MGSIRLPQGKDLLEAYALVEQHITKNHDIKSISSHQLHSITHAAFRDIKADQKTHKKKWITQESGTLLISAVEKILVSAKTPWEPKLSPNSKMEKLFLNILQGSVPDAKELFKEKRILKAVIYKKDPELLAESRNFLKNIFVDMFHQHDLNSLTPERAFHMEMVIGDLLSLYPFLRPEHGEKIEVPLRINGQWQLVSYVTEQIELTPSWMGSPLTAFGLQPEGNQPPILLFKGTTYPSDAGFSLSLLTDLNPFASIGAYAFRIGRKKIKSWLDKQENKAIIYGKSLGGAQAWRTALYYPHKVEKVMAFAAPGLYPSEIKRLSRILSKPDHPEINLFCQKGDLSPYVGFAPTTKKVKFYQVFGGKARKGFLAHADMFSTHQSSTLIRMDNKDIQKKWMRIALIALRTVFSLFLFPLLFLAHLSVTAGKKLANVITRS